MQSVEAFTFVDKETGDLIQTGTGDYSLQASQTRAIADFHAPIGVFHTFDGYASNPQFAFEYTSSEFHNAKVKQPIAVLETTISPCARKPRIISPTHFYVSHPTYCALKEDIESCLKDRVELVFSDFSKKQMVSAYSVQKN
jgi:hypothetical protein